MSWTGEANTAAGGPGVAKPELVAAGADTRRWRALAWLVWVAIMIHDTEELVTMAATYRRLSPMIERVGMTEQVTAMGGFRVINVGVSLLALALTAAGTARTAARPAGRPLLPALVAATMLLNVVVPHVPATIVTGGYTSGVISAVLLVAPTCGGLLWYLHRGQMLEKRVLVRLLAMGIGLIALALPLSLTVAGYVAGT